MGSSCSTCCRLRHSRRDRPQRVSALSTGRGWGGIALLPRRALPRVLGAGGLTGAVGLGDVVLDPHGAVGAVDASRLQGTGEIADLRLVVDVAAALGDDREEQIGAPRVEIELAV